jgi:hypothetical protein
MAKPNKKAPESCVDIYCNKCKTQLFKYSKGGKGSLLKCFKQRIIFARDTLIRGTPAFKIIGGKVFTK